MNSCVETHIAFIRDGHAASLTNANMCCIHLVEKGRFIVTRHAKKDVQIEMQATHYNVTTDAVVVDLTSKI